MHDIVVYGPKLDKITCFYLSYDCEDDKSERYIRIEASNLYDAGFEVGRRTARRIRAYVQTDEMVELLNFVQTPTGAATFAALKRDNSKSFPDLVEEIKGVAHGARVSENIVNSFIGNV